MKGMDLSYSYSIALEVLFLENKKNIFGEIPNRIVALAVLIHLNFSQNKLVGKIPKEIGKMKSLESLDLHMNNLSGTIPQSMSFLNSLEYSIFHTTTYLGVFHQVINCKHLSPILEHTREANCE
jgi:hypothetical protein